ncbi:holo-[acyl-carrier protein] synthase [Streptomyces zagrosensis]|uniref:Holo-[acyl-carrier-protein] synthase n=1 Tax=Streptomyces zagrosensis TaxID=1042984 RepID=A0A7W9QGJ7_9ACTN|nr:holo-[acyl-carrier protein] synthase [Streptomyces zagrosensis]
MIVGVGIDVAEIDRFGAAMERTPGLADRVFVERELYLPSGERRGIASLAARFAAKEALAKALGAPRGLRWTDAEIWTLPSGQPRLRVRGTVAQCAARLGVRTWHVSLSHDAGVASAVVIAEGDAPAADDAAAEDAAFAAEAGYAEGTAPAEGDS